MWQGDADLKLKTRSIDRRMFTILMIVFVQMFGASMVLSRSCRSMPRAAFNMKAEVITLLADCLFSRRSSWPVPSSDVCRTRRGRLPVLIFSQLGTVIAFLMIAVAQSAAVLFLARILDGVTGGNIVVAQAYVTDIVPEAAADRGARLRYGSDRLGIRDWSRGGRTLGKRLWSTDPLCFCGGSGSGHGCPDPFHAGRIAEPRRTPTQPRERCRQAATDCS